MSKVIEWVEQCKSCKGVGLYVGFAELDGAAVECRTCHGTGRKEQRIEYDEFQGRQDTPVEITRVWACNPGIGLSPGHTSGGVPVIAWQLRHDAPHQSGRELRSHTCPAWWHQTAGTPKPEWKECGFGRFSDCQHFSQKARCWERLDREREAGNE